MTIEEFIKKYHLGKTLSTLAQRPDKVMDDMPRGSTHWSITLSCAGREFHTYFSQGPALKKPPTFEDIMIALQGDAQTAEWYDPFEFMLEFGYTNARQAKLVYEACTKAAGELRAWLGDEVFEEFLECEEE